MARETILLSQLFELDLTMSGRPTGSLYDIVMSDWKTFGSGLIALILAIWLLTSSVGQRGFFASLLVVIAGILFARGLWNLKKERARLQSTRYRGDTSGGVERLGRDETERED